MVRTGGVENIAAGLYRRTSVGSNTPTRTMRPKTVRLRVDPERVRVSIRKMEENVWIATVRHVDSNLALIGKTASTPEEAIEKALDYAAAEKMADLNLDLEWAYDHPFLKEWR